MSSSRRQALSSTRKGSREKSGIEYSDGDEMKVWQPRKIVEKIQKARGDPDDAKNELPEQELPGFGQEYDDCGDEVPHACGACGAPVAVGRTCYRSTCPRCAPAWAMRTATSAGAKLEATRRYYYERRGQSPRFHHMMFSPPKGFSVSREEPLEAGIEIVKEMCDQLGVDGGVVVYHPYRGDEGDDRGFWKDLLFGGATWDEAREQISHEPHFHVIALGRFVSGGNYTNTLHEKTGWTYKRITKQDSNVSLYGDYDLARALTYSLSHAGIDTSGDRNTASYRYFGAVANMSASESVESEIDEAVRSVAPKTLGIEYKSESCIRDDEGDDGASQPSGSDSDPDDEDDEPDLCGGKLIPISKARGLLRDRAWVAHASRVDELVQYLRPDKAEPPPEAD